MALVLYPNTVELGLSMAFLARAVLVSVYHDGNPVSLVLVNHNWDAAKHEFIVPNAQYNIMVTAKGQFITEWLLDVFIWTKKTNENISVFLP